MKRWLRRMAAALRAGGDARTLRVAIGTGTAQAAGTVFVAGLVLAAHSPAVALAVGAAALAGRGVSGLIHQLVRRGRSAFVLASAVGALAVDAMALGTSSTLGLAVAAGAGGAFLGALADRLPGRDRGPRDTSGQDLTAIATAAGCAGAFVATVAADLVGGAHHGSAWASTVAGLAVAAVGISGAYRDGSARPDATPGVRRSRVSVLGHLRALCARLRWYPLIPLAASIAGSDGAAITALFVGWFMVVVYGRDRESEGIAVLAEALNDLSYNHKFGQSGIAASEAHPGFGSNDLPTDHHGGHGGRSPESLTGGFGSDPPAWPTL